MAKPSGAAKVAAIKHKQAKAKAVAAKPQTPPAKAAKAKAPPPETPVAEAPLPKGGMRKQVLEEAWRGWPAVERFGLYFHKADGDEFVCYHKFAACYAARKFIEAASGGAELRMLPNGDLSAGRYVVRSPNPDRYGEAAKVCASMQEVFDHKYNDLEKAWPLPVPYDGMAAMLAGTKHPLQQRMEDAMVRQGLDPTVEAAKRASGGSKAEAGPKAPRAPRAAGGAASGDPYAIKADMPWDQKVRRMAKKMQHDATGSEDGWRNLKAAAEKRCKEQNL
jgi:hypothetical protein